MVTCGVYAELTLAACPHSLFPISDFRFLTSDFQFPLPLRPQLSTGDYELSTFPLTLLESISMRRAWKRKSSGLKLFGISKCTARTQKNRPCKCLGMRALQSMWVSSPLESVFAKNLGVPPLCAAMGNPEANGNETTAGGRRAVVGPWGAGRFSAQARDFPLRRRGNFTRGRHVDSSRIVLLEVAHVL